MKYWWAVWLALAAIPRAHAAEPMLFVYFKEPANMGVFFAVSGEGYAFHPLNGGKHPRLRINRKWTIFRVASTDRNQISGLLTSQNEDLAFLSFPSTGRGFLVSMP